MRHRSHKTISFLENINKTTYSNVFEAFLFSFGSTKILRDNLRAVQPKLNNLQAEELRKNKARFHVFMHRLKKDGLIDKSSDSLTLTKKGKLLLQKIKLIPSGDYKDQIREDGVILVAFDIPEKMSSKRFWLRGSLRSLEFEMLQKSVWLGKKKVPKQFLEDLKTLGLVSFVEILEISKLGSIKKIID